MKTSSIRRAKFLPFVHHSIPNPLSAFPSLAMTYKTQFSFLALLVLLILSGEALAGRQTPHGSKNVDVKQPSFLSSDNSALIPGIGRVLLPPGLSGHPAFHLPPYDPYAGARGHSYVPGGDDTFIPNPGFEVPIPGKAGTAAVHP
ncbi:hypothetical protein Tsubulata_032193 [Turnera subulata]|uniref:Cell wall protein n=1 Tax=Turnera subulata TaxID=218843 RepID=A0A9Q0EY35_9ROSI|nr:hypothetical protein Tsubulata_032193 [Turnera subulata]